jgi:hypothetical protein
MGHGGGALGNPPEMAATADRLKEIFLRAFYNRDLAPGTPRPGHGAAGRENPEQVFRAGHSWKCLKNGLD